MFKLWCECGIRLIGNNLNVVSKFSFQIRELGNLRSNFKAPNDLFSLCTRISLAAHSRLILFYLFVLALGSYS